MRKNLFLTSVLVLVGLMRSALAETFPTDGYMLEDKTYENAATYTNLGKYDGEVTATAEYTDLSYSVPAGSYLPAGSEETQTCPANNFCAGMTDTTYNETDDQGLSSCPEGYPNSAAGASAETQCYTACKVSDVAHATGVTGNQYYGGSNTCTPTSCDKGYNTDEAYYVIEHTPLIPVDYTVNGDGYAYIKVDGKAYNDKNFTDAGLTENGTWAVHFDYGIVYGRVSCQPSVHNEVALYMEEGSKKILSGTMTLDEYIKGLEKLLGKTKVDAMLNPGAKDIDNIVSYSTDYNSNYNVMDTGLECYCQMTGFAPTGGSFESVDGAPWVWNRTWTNYGSAEDCAYSCPSFCASNLRQSDSHRAAAFKAKVPAYTCEQTFYNVPAGTYLPADSEGETQTCPANSYCPGMMNATYNESEAQGINTCPTDYPSSDAGAGTQTQCYTGCKISDIEHALGITGNNYYGGYSTCTPTSCDNGYHPEAGELKFVDGDLLIPVDYTIGGDGAAYVDANSVAQNQNFANAGLTEPNTWAGHYDYGVVYGQASCQPSDGNAMEALGYLEANFDAIMGGEMIYEELESGLAEIVGSAKAIYATDILRNMMSGMENGTMDENQMMMELYRAMFSVTLEPDANYSTTDSGQHCYCQMTGFTPSDGSYGAVTGAPWVNTSWMAPTDNCMSECSMTCAMMVVSDYPDEPTFDIIRTLVFNSVRSSSISGMCDANDITINWSDAEEIGDAGMCKYGGDIKTPVKAVAKKGKTFKGWKFSKAN